MADEDRASLLLLDKSFSTLMNESLANLESTAISNGGPGGTARLILAKVNSHLATFYDTFTINHAQAFLSKAAGRSLELIGEVLNCVRFTNESDAEFKFRISNQSLSLERANETSIRLAILSVSGVRDVILKPFTHGTGSFSAYIVTNEADPTDSLLESVRQALVGVTAYGVKASVFKPRLAPVEIRVRLTFDQKVGDLDKTLIRNQMTQMARTYIATLKPGDQIVIKDLLKVMSAVSPSILNIEIYHFMIRNRPMLLVNQKTAWNERFTESSTAGSILVS
jgi:hypothetical protein